MSGERLRDSGRRPSGWRAAAVAALSLVAGGVLVGVGLAVTFEANSFTAPRDGPRAGYLALLGLTGLAALAAPPLAAHLLLHRIPLWSVAIVLTGVALAVVILGLGGI